MSTRSNVKISVDGQTTYLYHHMDGYLAYVGATVAIAARKVQEGVLEASQLVDWFTRCCPNKNFELTDCQHMDIEYFYHIKVLSSEGKVDIGLATKEGYIDRNIEYQTRNYQVKTFIKLVNQARRNTSLRKLRLPRL